MISIVAVLLLAKCRRTLRKALATFIIVQPWISILTGDERGFPTRCTQMYNYCWKTVNNKKTAIFASCAKCRYKCIILLQCTLSSFSGCSPTQQRTGNNQNSFYDLQQSWWGPLTGHSLASLSTGWNQAVIWVVSFVSWCRGLDGKCFWNRARSALCTSLTWMVFVVPTYNALSWTPCWPVLPSCSGGCVPHLRSLKHFSEPPSAIHFVAVSLPALPCAKELLDGWCHRLRLVK